ncbi:AEC family transporter [Guggenheimella bovis]
MIHAVLVFFLLIFVGFIAEKSGRIPSDFRKSASAFVVNIALPFFILQGMAFKFSKEMLVNSLWILGVSATLYILSMLGSRLYRGEASSAYRFGLVFSNCGFMGIPLVGALYGNEALFYASIMLISFNTSMWTYGVRLFSKPEGSTLKSLLNPSLVCVVLGFTMFILDISWPPVLLELITLVGSTATPISMIVLGMMITDFRLSDVTTDPKPVIFSILRLVVIPLVMLFSLRAVGFSGHLVNIPVILFAMPMAVNGAMFAEYYDVNAKEMATLVVVSTLLSMASIPFITMFL